jgi:hypothetical protein
MASVDPLQAKRDDRAEAAAVEATLIQASAPAPCRLLPMPASPPCALAIRSTIARPSPVPPRPRASSARLKRSNARGKKSGGTPESSGLSKAMKKYAALAALLVALIAAPSAARARPGSRPGRNAGRRIAEGRPPPERQRLGRSPTLLQLVETIQIELALVDAEEVAGGLGLHPFPAHKLP